MKRIIYFLLLFFNYSIFCDTDFLGKKYFYTDEYGFVIINKDSMEFENRSINGTFVPSPNFDVFKSENIDYIILSYKNKNADFLTLVKKLDIKSEYNSWEMTYSENLNNKYSSAAKLVGFNIINANAYLTEKDKNGNNIKFLPKQFFNVVSNPWAVSAKDTNPTILLNCERYRVSEFKYADIEEIVFINGFINPEKQYLYKENARAKNIRIKYDKIDFIATLKDTGNYQSVLLPEKISVDSNTTISIEILDSYSGSKYSDIVISGILYVDMSNRK